MYKAPYKDTAYSRKGLRDFMWKRMEINKEDITVEDLLWNQDLIYELTLREIERTVARGAPLEEISEVSGIPLEELTAEESSLEHRSTLYGELMKKLEPLGRIDDLIAATADEAKLSDLAHEFGLQI